MVKKLIIFEMANNHQGDLMHGLSIIDKFSSFVSKYKQFDFAIKFQFRNLETFIHKDFKGNKDNKNVKRFEETSLSLNDFKTLKDRAEMYGFIPICTAFDEPSVNAVVEMGFKYIKIASCSLTDWPLLNKIAEVIDDIPIIASTAGATLEDIDNVVSFFTHRNKTISLMHCVGEYPTESKNFNLNQIDLLKKKYPTLRIGFSTHEKADELNVIKIAISKGAEIFEKHIGFYKLNDYSAEPLDIECWLMAISETLEKCGIENQRHVFTGKELNDLNQFRRGVFLKEDIRAGEYICKKDVYYAYPSQEGQLFANDMSKYSLFVAQKDIQKDKPVFYSEITKIDIREDIYKYVQKIKGLILISGISIPKDIPLEISHHYGIKRFDKFGIASMTIVNRGYCKKLLFMLPGQSHPPQYHKSKEETFEILSGNLVISKSKVKVGEKAADIFIMNKGDITTIMPNIIHSFSTDIGCIIEEISDTHNASDSFYLDSIIVNNKHRKTEVQHWL
jgi:sialic acid synthase SpsE/mannose-6-phosphate isomerase-like protein (cupin superfamily)